MDFIVIERSVLERLKARVERLSNRVKQLSSNCTIGMGEWLDNQDVCELLSVSYKTLQNYRANGSLAYAMIEHKIFYRKEDVINFLNSKKCQN